MSTPELFERMNASRLGAMSPRMDVLLHDDARVVHHEMLERRSRKGEAVVAAVIESKNRETAGPKAAGKP